MDARETVDCILEDMKEGRLRQGAAGALPALEALLTSRGRAPASLVSWEGYKRMEAVETAAGAAAGKPREKLTRVEEMLQAAVK